MRRRCLECREEKPATLEFFYAMRSHKSGLQMRCKSCDNRHRGQAQAVGDTIYHTIARELGVTVTRVKQIEASALRKLRRNRTLREIA